MDLIQYKDASASLPSPGEPSGGRDVFLLVLVFCPWTYLFELYWVQ